MLIQRCESVRWRSAAAALMRNVSEASRSRTACSTGWTARISKRCSTRILRPGKPRYQSTSTATPPQPPRNPVGIEMLPPSLRDQMFPSSTTASAPPGTSSGAKMDPRLLDVCRRHLSKHQLWGKSATTSTTTSTAEDFTCQLRLPPLQGGAADGTLEGHFQAIAWKRYGWYLEQAKALCRSDLPAMPAQWQLQPGWTRYDAHDGSHRSVPCPEEGEALVFDVEVLKPQSPYPVMAVAASARAWYGWVSPVVVGTSQDFRHLVPMTGDARTLSEDTRTLSGDATTTDIPAAANPRRPQRLLVGHHIAFDRARLLDEYALNPKAELRFLDTMSLHVAVSGLTSNQRAVWKKIDKELKTEESLRTFDEADLEWFQVSALNSLQSVAKFYLNKELDKSKRDVFMEGTLEEVRQQFPSLMDYCAKDVLITHQVYQAVFPKFLAKKIQGNPVSFAGMLEMGSVFLPISRKWPEYLRRCEERMSEAQSKVAAKLKELAEECLESTEEQRRHDPFLRQFDWTIGGKRKLPKWYRQLIPARQTEPVMTIRTRATPLLLRMTWSGYPLFYLGKTFGWCYRVPKRELTDSMREVPVTLEELEESTRAHVEKSKSGTSSESFFLELLRQDGGEYHFYRLPNLRGGGGGGGNDLNCGSPLAKGFLSCFTEGKMKAEHPIAREAVEANSSCAYWISARDRIMDQFVVWPEDLGKAATISDGPISVDREIGTPNDPGATTHDDFGILLPPMVPMGTITRRAVESTWLTASNAKKDRIGSELKSNVVAPPGYVLVGADVDSQELWIASLLGDRQFGVHGGTAFGWMTLQGNKADGTDLHSRSAEILSASRDHAKIFNYARIYGSGVKFTAALLARCNPSISPTEAQDRAKDLYAKTKGNRWMRPNYSRSSLYSLYQNTSASVRKHLSQPFWYGGTESYMFNGLEEVAFSEDPRTPVLGCQLPDSLLPIATRRKYQTSCINWVVQSSGVDYLHLLLVSMGYLIETYGIQARLLITIHDEIRYLVKEEDSLRAAFALQISNVWTRAYFAQKCGMDDLPLSVAFFSAVDVDSVLRKEVFDKCVTPSQPEGISEEGKSWSMEELMKQVGTELMGPDDKPVEMTANVPRQHDAAPSNGMQTPVTLSPERKLWLEMQMCSDKEELVQLLRGAPPPTSHSAGSSAFPKVREHVVKGF